jgi:peptidoglycan hydrolase-like protein with peptidoglycan-binding domain
VNHRRLPWRAAAAAALATLAAYPASAHAAFGDRPLHRGSHGHDVRVLQHWLGLVGFATPVDGRFGRGTARAVRRYERRLGLRVDGRVSRLQARDLRRRAATARTSGTGAPAPAPGTRATLAPDGRTAIAPAAAPSAVQAAISVANKITERPYRYGGGHGSFTDTGYDCSGAVSYALHGAGVLRTPRDSSGLMRFGAAGEGRWITVYAHGAHAFAIIAGLRFDTSGRGEEGPRWRSEPRSGDGYAERHPAGL